MPSRYELSNEQWERIENLLPGKRGDPGRTAANNRKFIDAVLWVLRSGARWSDLPERYGKYKTVHKRFTRWSYKGIWEQIFKVLIKDRDNEYLMIDSTLIKAHQQAATFIPTPPQKLGFRLRQSNAIRRSKTTLYY